MIANNGKTNWDELRMHAYAAGISPSDFWELTPHEIFLAIRGHQKRTEGILEIAAWHVAHVLNIVAKKGQRITPAKLLGKAKDVPLHRGSLTMRWAELEDSDA